MTCIIGVECDDRVIIGGDIQATGETYKTDSDRPKVFSKNGIIFGYSTSYRFGQIVENYANDLLLPDKKADIYSWLFRDVVEKIRKTLKDLGCNDGGEMLIGVRNELWTLQQDFSIIRSTRGYASIGSGDLYALGAMRNMYRRDMKVEEAERVIRECVETASDFCPQVGKDSILIKT